MSVIKLNKLINEKIRNRHITVNQLEVDINEVKAMIEHKDFDFTYVKPKVFKIM